MSGHNKWSKIKNKKAVTDAKKSQIFAKFSKLISNESKKAEGNTESPNLRTAIEKAKAANMPLSNIDKAVGKGASSDGESMESVTYEAYVYDGSALIIEALTDNRNRASQEIKHVLTKNGFSLATPGSATWAFKKDSGDWTPQNTTEVKEVKQLEKLIDELEELDDVQEVFTNAEINNE